MLPHRRTVPKPAPWYVDDQLPAVPQPWVIGYILEVVTTRYGPCYGPCYAVVLSQHDMRWSQKGGALSVSVMARVIAGLVRDGAARQLVPGTTTAHTLRHTFASHYLATHTNDLVGVATLLGHSSLNSTRIYVQPTAEQLADRVERIDLNAESASPVMVALDVRSGKDGHFPKTAFTLD